jgi:hypothetical protein
MRNLIVVSCAVLLLTSREVGEFWSKVGAGSSWGGHASQHEAFNGYRVLGTSWSGEARAGHENSGAGGNMEWTIKTRKHVGALVAKFFPTMEEATEHVQVIRKQRDERREAAKAVEERH